MTAEEFVASLSSPERWQLQDHLVLSGSPDWREYLDQPPPKGFWTKASRLLQLWEESQ